MKRLKSGDRMVSDKSAEIHILENHQDIKTWCDLIPYISKGAMCAIFNELSFPLTIIHDRNYVDRVYRDAYYSYFSNKHFDMPRNCQRLAIWQN